MRPPDPSPSDRPEPLDREELLAHLPFRVDRFQTDAFDALDRGEHVVVAAPTGSGKTVVADYAVDVALRRGRRAFYTTPIKALSNQKFRDLSERLGEHVVGLLTGDVAVRGDAPVVVMTTEVLRNMIYGGSVVLDDVDVVVLDEVHFLQDTYRGPVWEEVIIQVPEHVRLVCLSATVSNADQLAAWIETVRGPTAAVVEERRPVPLHQQYLVADRTEDQLRLMPVFSDGGINPDGPTYDREPGRGRDRYGPRRRYATPGRVETVRLLQRRDLLPVIHFIFSRNQCDEAAAACLDAGLSLSDPERRERVRAVATERLGLLDPSDLAILGHRRFLDQLEAGIVAHHAGMVPAFKEVVETCFAAGLVQVVFATETLAVGVNMPARSVVIDKLTKYNGDHHERLSPAQYTQLTGRAGRRGIDTEGDAIVLWSPWVRFDEVAQLAASRSFHLRSAFRPTYNLAANLVNRHDEDTARRFVDLSFAQFQADRDVVRIQARLDHLRNRLEGLRDDARSPFGDLEEFRRQRLQVPVGEPDPIEEALARLRPGDVIHVDHGKHRAPGVVVATAHRRGGLKLTVIVPSGDSIRLVASDFEVPPRVVGTVRLPPDQAPDRREYRRDVARRLRTTEVEPRRRGRSRSRRPDPASAHPVEDDPDLERRLRAASRADAVAREVAQLEDRSHRHRHSLSDALDRVLGLLDSRGYVDRAAWTLSDAGRMLARTFHEADLLVTECLRAGLLDGLEAPDVAALVSMFVYEHRSPSDPLPPWYPTAEVRRRGEEILRISDHLAAEEEAAGITPHRRPDPGFVAVAHGWVAGGSFADVLDEDEMTGGDLVRTVRQLVDLLGQVGANADDPATRRAARRAASEAYRDVVADTADPAGIRNESTR